MAKQIIDIGVQGNDGTGDSIRDSFRKVNENFNEIYGIFGQGRITLSQLGDGTSYDRNQLIMGNNTGNTLVARDIVPGENVNIVIADGIDPDTELAYHTVTISSNAAQLSQDTSPEIRFPFNVNLNPIGRVPDPSQALVDAFNLQWDTQTTLNELPVNVGYATKNFLSVQNGVIGQFDSTGRFVQPSLTTVSSSTIDTTSEFYDPTLTGNYLTTSLVPRKDLVYRGGDTMSGPLILDDHPKDLAGISGATSKSDLQAATAFYVDNKTFASNVNLYVATSGDDLQTQTPTGKEGRFWNYAFRSVKSALLQAESLINVASQEPGSYKQRISYTIGPDQSFSTIKKVTLTDGKSTDSGYVAAFNLLQANREFIQAETIAYINKRYVNPFAYTRTELTGKISALLSNIKDDLLLGSTNPDSSTSGTNYNSYWEGISYLYNNPTSDGLIQWVDTVNFIRDQIIDFSYDTIALQSYTSQLFDAMLYDFLFSSNYQSIQAGIAFKNAETKISSSQLISMLTINPITILSAEVTGSIVTLTFNDQDYNLFPKDSQIFINATFTSKTISSNPVVLSSTVAGSPVAFTVDSSTVSSVSFKKGSLPLIVDKFNVVGKIDRKNLINLMLLDSRVVGYPAAESSFKSSAALVSNYLLTGDLPEVSYPYPLRPAGINVSFTDSTDVVTLSNHGLSSGTTVKFTAISSTTGILTNTTYHVINTTTNTFQISASFNGSAIILTTNGTGILAWDTAGHVSAKSLLLENIEFIQAETIAFLSAKYSDVVYDKALSKRDVKYVIWSLIYDFMYGGNSQSVYAGKQFWANSSSNFIKDSEKTACIRAIEHLNLVVQAVVLNDPPAVSYQQSVRQYRNDTLLNGSVTSTSLSTNIALVASILTDIDNVPSTIIFPDSGIADIDYEPKFTAIIPTKNIYTTGLTTSTSWFMDHFYPVINDDITQDKIINLFKTITDIIESGQSPTTLPTFPEITISPPVNDDITDAQIRQARSLLPYSVINTIATSTSAYMVSTYGPSTGYNIDIDTAALIQNIKNIVIATLYDITYGGTTAVRRAGTLFKVSVVGTSDNRLTAITKASQLTLTYITNHIEDDVSNTVAALIGLKFSSVFSAVTDSDLLNYELYIGNTYLPSIILNSIITDNTTAITNNTVDYVNATFAGGFDYDESSWFSNVGYIVDAVSTDIITGGTWQSINFGKSFYKDAVSRKLTVGGTYYTQSVDSLTFAKKICLQVLNKQTAVRFQTFPQITSFSSLTKLPSTKINVIGNTNAIIASSRTVDFTAIGNIVTLVNHGLENGAIVSFSSTTNGIATNTSYYVINAATNTFKISLLLSGSAVTFTTDGTGVLVSNDSTTKFTNSFQSVLDIIQFGVGVAPTPIFSTGIWHIVIENGGRGYVDQGSPLNNDIFPAKVIVGVGATATSTAASDAYASIVKYIPNSDTSGTGVLTNVDTIQVRLTRPGFFNVNEELEFGETVRDLNITVFVESGIYYEDYPLKLPANVSIKGDEFRRTLIRPRDRISQSPWVSTFFYRDAIIDGLEIGLVDYNGVDHAPTGVSATLDGTTSKIIVTLTNNYQALLSWVGKVIVDMNVANGQSLSYTNPNVYATIVSGTGSTTGTILGANLTGTIEIGDYVSGTNIPHGSKITEVNMSLNPRTFTIAFPFATDTAAATSTAELRFIKATEGNKKRGKAVIDSVSGNTVNCTVIYPFAVAGTYVPQTWRLFGTKNYGRHYLTNPLDPNSAPKNNKEIDVLLCNEGNRVLGMTFQGHGGFAMVLDPEGNIKTKSPYIQECSSFSQSNNYKRFAGGQFIDGFAGRLYGTITGIADAGITVTVVGETNSGLDVRPPQPPCAFYVRGKRYQVDDVVDFNPTTRTVILTLDKSTPYLYTTTGVLTYSDSKSKRDSGYILDAIASDAALQTNYRSVHAGRRFLDAYSSRIIGDLQDLTIAGITKLVTEAKSYISNNTYSSVRASYDTNLTYIVGMIANGVTATPEIVWSTSSTLDKNLARKIIQNNKAFIKSEISAYLASTSTISLSSYSKYDVLTSERDLSYVLDAMTYDMLTGDGDSQTKDRVESFYFEGTSYIAAGNVVYGAAYNRLKVILPYIIAGTPIPSVSPGNSVSQILAIATLSNSSISGTTLTVGTAIGNISAGMYVTGGTIPAGTYITGNIAGIGSGSTWTVNQTVTATGLITITGDGPPLTPTTYATKLTGLCDIVSNYLTNDGFYDGDFSSTRTYPTITAGTNKDAYNVFFTDVVDTSGSNINRPGKTSTELAIEDTISNYLQNGASLTINMETGGNRSMLANDFAMFNDLAYGIIATNGAFTEQVCTFTYYAHTGLWSNNGSNIRGVGCSNTFGNYGMRASGYDVTELPDSANLANHMLQTARIYKQGVTANEMTPTATIPAQAIWIVGYDFRPTNGSLIEIDHSAYGGTINTYTATAIEYTTIQVGSGANGIVLKISLNTSGTGSAGLATTLYDGQLVSIRSVKSFKFINIDNVKPTRPSTALQYVDSLNDVYRIVAYNLNESTGDSLGDNIAILQSDNSFAYYSFTTDTKSISTGDPASSIYTSILTHGGFTTSTSLIVTSKSNIVVGQVICGTGWAGQTVVSVGADAIMSTSSITGTTLTVGSVFGTIVIGMYLTGGTIPAGTYITAGSGSTWTVYNPTVLSFAQTSTTITGIGAIVLSAVPSTSPYGTVYFSTKTQGSKIGDTKIAVNQVSQLKTIDQINKGKFITTYNGRLHRILSYVTPTFALTKSYSSYAVVDSIPTLIIAGKPGSIAVGDLIVKRNAGTEYLEFTGNVSLILYNGDAAGTTTIQVSNMDLIISSIGLITQGLVSFGTTSTGYLVISDNALINNAANGVKIDALDYADISLQPNSLTAKIVKFDIPFSKDNILPRVDSYVTIAGNTSNYNGDRQIVGLVSQTVITLSSIADFQVGMVVTSQVTIQSVSVAAGVTTFTSTASHNLNNGDIVTANIDKNSYGFVVGTSYTVANVNAVAKTFTITGSFGIEVATGVVIVSVATATTESVFTTNAAHGRANGYAFKPNIGTNGFITGTTYYFKDVTATTFKLAVWNSITNTIGAPLGTFLNKTSFAIPVSLKTPQTAIIPGGSAIIQAVSTDTLVPTITISPAAWVPANAPIRASLAANVASITIVQAGAGYTSAPTIVIDGGSPTLSATATCTIANGSINEVRVVIKGSGYINPPSITVTPVLGNIPTLQAELSAVMSTAVLREETSSAGISTTQLSVLYTADPGTFTTQAALPVSFTSLTVSSPATKTTNVTYNSVTGVTITYTVSGSIKPSVDTWCKVRLNGTASFNGSYQVYSTDATHITLFYPTDPGNALTGGNVTSTIITLPIFGAAVTFTDTGDIVTLTSHGLVNGNIIKFASITSTTGISANTNYYVVSASTDTFQVSSNGTTPLTLSTNGTGVLSVSNNSFSVTYPVTGTLPTVSSRCKVTGNVNSLYNGYVTVTERNTVANTVTVLYPSNPGLYTFSGLVSASGSIGATITGTGPWTGTITGMLSVNGLSIGSTITATDDVGKLFGGTPTSIIVESIVSSSSITFTVTGGTTPIAGSITNIINTSLPTVNVTPTPTNAASTTLGISKPFNTKTSYTFNIGYPSDTAAQVTTRISTCRATGHDFCDIGTGGYSTTNIPYSIYGEPALSRQETNETLDESVGRCFYVSTNQDGIFRVGKFFSVDQGTGVVTLSSKTALSNIEAFGFSGGGAVVRMFSTDSTMTDNAATKVPVESAVRGYIDKRLGFDHGGSPMPFASIIGPGFLPLTGTAPMTGDLALGGHRITGVSYPSGDNDAASKLYVDTIAKAQNELSELIDVNFTSSTLADAQLLVQRNTGVTGTNKWINSTLTGDVTIEFVSGTLVSTINAGNIVNSMISSVAEIDQPKLKLDNAYAVQVAADTLTDVITATAGSCTATTVTLTFATQVAQPFAAGSRIKVAGFTPSAYNGIWVVTGGSVTTVQYTVLATIANATAPFTSSTITALRGISAYNSSQFKVTNGWVELKTASATTDGININKLQYIATGNILGNRSGSTGPVTLITPANVVTDGDGIKNASFTSTGVMIVSTLSSNKASAFTVIDFTSTGENSKIVQTKSGGEIDTKQLQINTYKTVSTAATSENSAATTKVILTTPGNFDFLTSVGNAATNNITNLYGTVDIAGTNNKLKVTSITTGAPATLGTLEGDWTVPTGSNLTVTGGINASTEGLTASIARPIIRPAVIFDFASSNMLDPRITFTRNSIGTYYDKAGILKVARAGQPRFDYDPETCVSKGLLLEEQRTNLLTFSATFGTDGATQVWSESATNNISHITRTSASGVIAPDNTTAIRFAAIGAAAIISTTVSTTGLSYKTFSVWLQQVTGTAAVSISLDNGTNWNPITITTTLTRYTVSRSVTGARVSIKIESGNSIIMWGAQLEEGAFATSYIPTTYNAVTRLVDDAYIDGSNFSSWYRQDEGTIIITHAASAIDISGNPNYYGGATVENTDSSSYMSVRCYTNLISNVGSIVYDAIGKTAGVTQFDFTGLTTTTVGSEVMHALAYKINSCAYGYNGTTDTDDTIAAIPTNMVRLTIGDNSGAQTVARIVYYSKRLLSDVDHNELRSITTQ